MQRLIFITSLLLCAMAGADSFFAGIGAAAGPPGRPVMGKRDQIASMGDWREARGGVGRSTTGATVTPIEAPPESAVPSTGKVGSLGKPPSAETESTSVRPDGNAPSTRPGLADLIGTCPDKCRASPNTDACFSQCVSSAQSFFNPAQSPPPPPMQQLQIQQMQQMQQMQQQQQQQQREEEKALLMTLLASQEKAKKESSGDSMLPLMLMMSQGSDDSGGSSSDMLPLMMMMSQDGESGEGSSNMLPLMMMMGN